MLPFVIPVPIPVSVTTKASFWGRVNVALLFCFILVVFAFVTKSPTAQHLNTSPTTTPPPTHAHHTPPQQSHANCRHTPLYVDPRRHATRHLTPKPLISVIYVTKRPGGYDMLLHSLAQQVRSTNHTYELICVDELAGFRAARVHSMAEQLHVPLVSVVPSKPKASHFRDLKFGIYNALNTGILLARGDIITFVMDLAWIPPNFVERTVEFYQDPQHAKSLLAYPEHFFFVQEEALPAQHAVADVHSLTIYGKNLTVPPRLKPDMFLSGQMRPETMVKDYRANIYRGFERQPLTEDGEGMFWELSFASCPWQLLEQLNGVEEQFDYGDDCHEGNIRLRSEFLGYDLWIDGQVVVENIWHKNHFEPKGDLWNRFREDNIMHDVLALEPELIRSGKRGVESQGHQFNLTEWRARDCASWV